MVLLSLKDQERERDKRIAKQIREASERKFANPDPVDLELEQVWTVYGWHAEMEPPQWMMQGFVRRRRRRKPQSMARFFARVRRRLGIDKKMPVKMMTLGESDRRVRQGDESWLFVSPSRQKRKPKMEQRTPRPVGKTTRRRAKVKAYKLSKRDTKYVAIGRNTWEREQRYLYLGPLKSEHKMNAIREARRMFCTHNDIVVLATDSLSKPLRAAMASGKRVRAGVTRIVWPEVPPTFDEMWVKFVRRTIKKDMHGMIAADDPRWVDVELALRSEWDAQNNPWLSLGWFRKQLKLWRLDSCGRPLPRKHPVKQARIRGRVPSTPPQRRLIRAVAPLLNRRKINDSPKTFVTLSQYLHHRSVLTLR